ncbi:hypothetical protein [Methylocystis hirsuta]|uniref:hypothetical protein n=1 Tax=Methylocystis hirsuta TaxID=369798 RepID=UPI0011CE4814|nr:hypothetical protein [Methylocystis hirsuta]
MPVILKEITIRNHGPKTTFTLEEPGTKKSIDIDQDQTGALKVDLPDVDFLRLSANDGSHSSQQSFGVKTALAGYNYYIYQVEISYHVGDFNGRICTRTGGWG